MIKKKHKVDVKPSEIKNHVFLFINCTVINPAFSSQTKEKLITEPKDFGTKHDVTEKFAKAVFGSEVIQSLLDWIEQKKNAEERAELRKLNKSLASTKVLKLIDAKGKDRNKCVLGIFEGMSALSAVRKFRDPQTFGAFPLKGKFLNVSEMTNSGVIQNDEVVQLMASLGIKLGEEPGDLRYGKVYIYTDADPDGDSIAGLLINFFNKYWPELFEQNRVFKVMTPLVVAKKGKEVKPFYSNDEYSEWEKKTGAKGWDVEYKKGLAALEDVEYRDIIHNPVLVKLQNDKQYKDSLSDWFGSDSEPRKEKLLKLSI
jgi:DNA topoisomerase-2